MRTDTTTYQGAFSSILLPGTILLANIDMTGLFDYALKALAGGAIWLGYKVVADHLERRKKIVSEQQKKEGRNKKKKFRNGIDQ